MVFKAWKTPFLKLVGELRIPKDLQKLKGEKPSFSLKATAHYFVDMLSQAEYNILKEICGALSRAGREVLIGTTCSGLETGGMVVEKTFAALNERFNTNVKVRSVFAAELIQDWYYILCSSKNGLVGKAQYRHQKLVSSTLLVVCVCVLYIYSIYIYTRMYVCMYGCMHACMYGCMDVCIYVCMHACMYVHVQYVSIIYVYYTKNNVLLFIWPVHLWDDHRVYFTLFFQVI